MLAQVYSFSRRLLWREPQWYLAIGIQNFITVSLWALLSDLVYTHILLPSLLIWPVKFLIFCIHSNVTCVTICRVEYIQMFHTTQLLFNLLWQISGFYMVTSCTRQQTNVSEITLFCKFFVSITESMCIQKRLFTESLYTNLWQTTKTGSQCY